MPKEKHSNKENATPTRVVQAGLLLQGCNETTECTLAHPQILLNMVAVTRKKPTARDCLLKADVGCGQLYACRIAAAQAALAMAATAAIVPI